jgi:hypothetical protein
MNSKTANRKAAKMLKKIKAEPISMVRLHFKFARCVTAMRELTDAMESLARDFVANEKYDRLPLRLRASAVKKGSR